jgi:CheY-specific phosphatase CheX
MLVTSSPDRQHGPWEATVTVLFRGPSRGSILLQIYGNVLPALAANMLGEEATPELQLQRDALGEVANVIAGNLIPTIAGTDVYDLESPIVRHRADGAEQAPPPGFAAETRLGLEEGCATIRLYLS